MITMAENNMIRVDVRQATHVRLRDGSMEPIASKWGIDAEGKYIKGGFGVVTEGGRRVEMWDAHSYWIAVPDPFVSECCLGERCFCGKPAEHKVEETIFPDDPTPGRHPFTAYVCHEHFRQVMGPAVDGARP